ncbi:MAG: hypothetical protein ACI4WM_07070 [Erysipelotrichaceae bacterium]
MKINNEIRESIVNSPRNILGEAVLDLRQREDKLKDLNDSYNKANRLAAEKKKEMVDYYHFMSAVSRYESYIESLGENEEYELFSYEAWR